jgi:hypothetical protein
MYTHIRKRDFSKDSLHLHCPKSTLIELGVFLHEVYLYRRSTSKNLRYS